MATGESFNYLPAGPILGLPLAMQAQEQHSNADRRIRGKKYCNSLIMSINWKYIPEKSKMWVDQYIASRIFEFTKVM